MSHDPMQGEALTQERLRLLELYEQAGAIFESHGMPLNPDVEQYLLPVLEQEQDLKQNRDMLLSMIERVGS